MQVLKAEKIAENIELVSVQKAKKFNILEFTYKLTNIDKDKFNLALFQKTLRMVNLHLFQIYLNRLRHRML